MIQNMVVPRLSSKYRNGFCIGTAIANVNVLIIIMGKLSKIRIGKILCSNSKICVLAIKDKCLSELYDSLCETYNRIAIRSNI